MLRPPPRSTLFPYMTLFRSSFNNATSTTDSVGVAHVQFTVGTTIGATYTITASGTNGVSGTSSTITVAHDLTPVTIRNATTSANIKQRRKEQSKHLTRKRIW